MRIDDFMAPHEPAGKVGPTPHHSRHLFEVIGEYQRRHPGMRLGQLILNAAHENGTDPFYMTDRRLTELIAAQLKRETLSRID